MYVRDGESESGLRWIRSDVLMGSFLAIGAVSDTTPWRGYAGRRTAWPTLLDTRRRRRGRDWTTSTPSSTSDASSVTSLALGTATGPPPYIRRSLVHILLQCRHPIVKPSWNGREIGTETLFDLILLTALHDFQKRLLTPGDSLDCNPRYINLLRIYLHISLVSGAVLHSIFNSLNCAQPWISSSVSSATFRQAMTLWDRGFLGGGGDGFFHLLLLGSAIRNECFLLRSSTMLNQCTNSDEIIWDGNLMWIAITFETILNRYDWGLPLLFATRKVCDVNMLQQSSIERNGENYRHLKRTEELVTFAFCIMQLW